MYDIAIMGGGVAGLAAGILGKKLGRNTAIFEREHIRSRAGHGFILLDTGLNVLRELGLNSNAYKFGHDLIFFELRSPNGSLLYSEPLYGAAGFLREQLLLALEAGLTSTVLHMGLGVKEVKMSSKTQKITSLILEDGSIVTAKLYIDAEGKHSLVRKKLFPHVQIAPGRVKEILCRVESPNLALELGHKFIKFIHPQGGISVGLVPCGGNEVVWYFQFDSDANQVSAQDPVSLREFILTRIGDWAMPVPLLLQHTDFNRAYLWNNEDLDTLPKLHGENVVLIGDAAHPFLTFTSQGVNSALRDVRVLEKALKLNSNLQDALENYSSKRRPELKRIVQTGRNMMKQFLLPDQFKNQFYLPFSK